MDSRYLVCHTAPPKLNDTGKKFKADGNKF
jgi:hypothetical protein